MKPFFFFRPFLNKNKKRVKKLIKGNRKNILSFFFLHPANKITKKYKRNKKTSKKKDSHIDDDLHTGLSSKKIWQRAPGEGLKRFSSDQELWFYINYHIRPYLQVLTASHDRLYIFIAVEIQFEKLANIADSCRRWSSYRNQHWFSGHLASEAERSQFIEGALQDFSQNCVYEIEGWLPRD